MFGSVLAPSAGLGAPLWNLSGHVAECFLGLYGLPCQGPEAVSCHECHLSNLWQVQRPMPRPHMAVEPLEVSG